MKKVFILILCLTLLLCGCAKDQTPEATELAVEESIGKEIPAEIVSAYDIDDADRKLIATLFEDCDEALEDLGYSSMEDEDFYDYANQINELVNQFEEDFDSEVPDQKLDSTEDKTEKLNLIDAMSTRANALTMPRSYLGFSLWDYSMGNCSGEKCAEDAFAVVNAYSQYYYTEDHITDDDLDKLG